MDKILALIMLVLLALPAFGISTSLSCCLGAGALNDTGFPNNGSSNSTEQQPETEEVEERIPSSSQRRDDRVRSPRGGFCLQAVNSTRRLLAVIIERPAVSGHRLTNGSLAPMRC